MKSKRKTILTTLIVIFVLANAFYFKNTDAAAPLSSSSGNSSSSSSSSTDNSSQIDSINSKMDSLNKKIQKATDQLSQQQSNLYTNQVQVYNTKSVLQQVEADIADKEQQITNLSQQEDLNKALLEGYVEELYYQAQENPLIQLAVTPIDLNGLTSNTDNMISIKEKILETLDDIGSNKSQLASDQADLTKQKQQHEQLLAQQTAQQGQIVSDIQDTQATLQELQQKMAQLQSDLSKILGQSYDTGQIKDAIKFAHKMTGVSSGYIFGMLSYESGGNPEAGNCTYGNSGMSSARKKDFVEIVDDLNKYDKKNYNYKKMPVSCASPDYPGSGGAMGAAQFMSDTWLGYEDRIAENTGDKYPDPWSLTDGTMAMALYLKDLGATNSGKVKIKDPCNGGSVSVSWEIYASMRYLGWSCYGYTNYAPGVQSLAEGYSQL